VNALAGALDAARDRSSLGVFIGEVELDCSTPECPVREVALVLKELDGPATPARLQCPACRRPLTLHHVVTLEEQRTAFERAARLSVNSQRYRRRTGEEAVPLSVLLDDRLPA
jgi:hypothetical protein